MAGPTSGHGEIQFEEAKVEESQLNVIGDRKPAGVSAQDLQGFGYTYRHNWGPRNGWWVLNLTSNSFTANTRAFVSISEGPTSSGGKFIGNARYSVYNIAPDNGVVAIRVFVDWPNPIGLVVDYFFVNP
ncbi:hypothetical protein [Streptomyces sp. MST-110588]|uniref:hypothetical protein n=1 Tax=Streptomyces sp. MST-110588 TaxID=2833628 RepID=UPI001F5C92F4|nr:hypothetical protein [Streptomyces sp. MST-110588]UNO42929.1 hypothetical protein KGS77_29750 [Streptomyces sp. MST-110588]